MDTFQSSSRTFTHIYDIVYLYFRLRFISAEVQKKERKKERELKSCFKHRQCIRFISCSAQQLLDVDQPHCIPSTESEESNNVDESHHDMHFSMCISLSRITVYPCRCADEIEALNTNSFCSESSTRWK